MDSVSDEGYTKKKNGSAFEYSRRSCDLLVRCLDGGDLLLLLGDALGNESVVLGLLLLLVLNLAGLDGVQVAAALETLGRDEALDFGAIVIQSIHEYIFSVNGETYAL